MVIAVDTGDEMNSQNDLIGKVQKRISTVWRWFAKQIRLTLALSILALFMLFFYRFGWSGFGPYSVNGQVVPAKTLWDWMGLLIIPGLLLFGGISINTSLQQIERERAEKRAESEQQIADDRLKEQALQTYLDRMSDLLLSGQLDNADTKEKAQTVARARTLTTLTGLDGERKGAVLQFLHESGLISGKTATLNLNKADFNDARCMSVSLTGANLVGTNFMAANLFGVDFSEAYLVGVEFVGTNLEKANLYWAHLSRANLRAAHLSRANLDGAHLDGANLTNAKVTQAQLYLAILDEKTILPDGSHYKPPASAAAPAASQPPAAQAAPDEDPIQPFPAAQASSDNNQMQKKSS